ncbi:SRPBCC family protein [Cellulomonas fengjieae]|uniref:SRPBCC family protein n=1 Tax=Cellulomonas fengjieae TaxID=2819978 RepID=A0ABS3SJT4_9CELL|nr:SRPBCC family protein [Cellulomonas fengjieae]MBO3086008.1 SRPBCC family protein [Cellulomonas fengjieae]QVI65923.1 SRPBCC family protein [Cellulomonas fengjieae]
MEVGSIEREIYVDAPPETVFEVLSTPEHIREWWGGAETDLTPTPGSVAEISWGRGTADEHIGPLTVVEADPPRLFSFRWTYDEGAEAATATNSLLVTFELVPSDAGTLLRLTETGFRENGWEAAVLEAAYDDHVTGWDLYVPAIAAYVARLVATP